MTNINPKNLDLLAPILDDLKLMKITGHDPAEDYPLEFLEALDAALAFLPDTEG